MNKKLRILVAEDDEIVLSLIAQAEEYDIVAVRNGEDCIAALEKEAFDAVILDVLMPKKSGLVVLRKLRKDHPETAAVVITGYGEILRPQVLEIGVDSFLEKPFTLDDLRRAVSAALDAVKNRPPSP